MSQRVAYKLNKEISAEVLKDAIKVAKSVEVDELDCSKSFARRPTNKTVEEILEIGLNSRALFNFIFRDVSDFREDNYWDVGLSTMDRPSYFLWIRLGEKEGYNLATKYELKKIE